MVFRRKARRSFGRGLKKYARNKTGGSIKVTDVLLAGALYGVARPIVANALPTMFSFGPIDSDNVLIGAAGWYGMKQKGLLKALGIVALGSEVGFVAAKAASGMTPTSNSGVSPY